jgi:AcrR family transcriptional regulator
MKEVEKVQKIKDLRENEFRSDLKRNRERFILENARTLLNTAGFQSLNLPEVAKISGYSKPTIYKYFPNKEDLLLALAIESAERQTVYFEKAVTFDGRPREKLHGIYALNITILQDAFQDILLVHSNKARSKATPERQQKFEVLEERRIEIISGIIREATENGDLRLPEGVDEYKLLFTLMSSNIGAYAMQQSDSPVMEKWFRQLNFTDGDFGLLILDGIGWKPLSIEWDYGKTIKRFYRELFPELLNHKRLIEKSSS